ncbi:MAG: hypothetical protein GY851_17500 [bacterium]|nr:hypothetical protein [bacterium]
MTQAAPAEGPWAHRLRSYIAPGCPARRTPCDGSESDMRVEFGFTPKWYRERLDIDFGERWHLDPAYRWETVAAMRRELNERFPGLSLGGPDPERSPPTLDGIHGAVLMSRVFGVPAEYYADNWPAATHDYLSEDALRGLRVLDLSTAPVFVQIFEQMDFMEREFGRIEGYLNWQGVLNTAYRLRGQTILMDLVVDPGLAHHVFEVITETMIAGARMVYERQRASGVEIRHLAVSNCLVNMVSADAYREHLMPYDKQLSDAFDHFGIHNCAWNVDPYLADYADIRTLGYVDMGIESDLVRAKELCPNTRRAVMYTPTDLANKPLDAIREDLARIRRELSPCDIVAADIEAGTPDERVMAFARMAEETLVIEG